MDTSCLCSPQIYPLSVLYDSSYLWSNPTPPSLPLSHPQDNTLLVSCSADKNIRIWGLDFGDCHKSIFAHDDCIMAIRFIPNTHMFFSASKDRTIKCWDADNFQHIQTLKVNTIQLLKYLS